MPLFFDNDIVHKLARCNLLDETSKLCTDDTKNISLLGSLRFRFNLHKGGAAALSKCGNQETVDRMIKFCASCSEIAPPTDHDTLALLSEIQHIDDGEAIMFASALESQNVLLFSGDKRAIRALSSHKGFSKKFHEGLICLEHLFINHIQAYGFEYINTRMNPARECDTVLKMAF